MNKKWFFAIIPGVLSLMILFFVLMLFLIKILWAWTIPDIFPGAVEKGLIVGEVSWFLSFKIALFTSVVFGIAKGHSSYSKRNS